LYLINIVIEEFSSHSQLPHESAELKIALFFNFYCFLPIVKPFKTIMKAQRAQLLIIRFLASCQGNTIIWQC